eukprot:2817419-Prorocentrum_lima.AAC.1
MLAVEVPLVEDSDELAVQEVLLLVEEGFLHWPLCRWTATLVAIGTISCRRVAGLLDVNSLKPARCGKS